MAVYWKFGTDVKGEVTVEGHKDEMEVQSMSWGASRSVSNPHGTATNREGAVPMISEMSLSRQMDKASTKLFEDMLGGTFKRESTFTMTTTASGNPVDYIQYILENSGLINYSVGAGSDGVPQESVTLSFSKMTYKFKPVASDGTGDYGSTSIDLTTMKLGS